MIVSRRQKRRRNRLLVHHRRRYRFVGGPIEWTKVWFFNEDASAFWTEQ